MSSADLNAVVAHTESPSAGDRAVSDGVPDEELGYIASEEYARNLSRSVSPELSRRSESPEKERSRPHSHVHDHNDVIHLEPTSGAGFFRRGNADTTPADTPQGEIIEEEANDIREVYSILAEDEVLKRSNVHMQAAISPPGGTPRLPRSRPRSIVQLDDIDSEQPKSSSNRPSLEVRPSRDTIKTPYENLSPADEFAPPLFPESDDEGAGAGDKEKPTNPAVAKLKRPGLSEQRFPSNDVWEEAPDHAHLSAIVDPPSQPADPEEEAHNPENHPRTTIGKQPQYVSGQPHHHFEPGDEQLLEEHQPPKSDYVVDVSKLPEDERLRKLIGDDKTPSDSGRASRASRRGFPSKDVWEDAPDSSNLEASVEPDTAERPTTGDASALPESEPEARPTTGTPLETSPTIITKTVSPTVPTKPTIPARPSRPSTEKPAIPARPKPAIPARPTKPTVLARAPSSGPESASSPTEQQPPKPQVKPKEKPIVPPRVGNKISALKAGLGDLESRLRFGPFGPKKEEEKKEEEPTVERKPELVEDVRKGRARGPRGRKAPTLQKKEEEVKETVKEGALGFSQIVTVWMVDADLERVVVGKDVLKEGKEEKKEEINEVKEVEERKEGGEKKEKNNEENKEEAKEEPVKEIQVDEKEEPVNEKVEEVAKEEPIVPQPEADETKLSTSGPEPIVSTTTPEPVKAEVDKPTVSDPPADKLDAAEEGNPTLIPSEEHPEDAKVQTTSEIKKEDVKDEKNEGEGKKKENTEANEPLKKNGSGEHEGLADAQ